ncbi:MAG TPA: hypothetical protein VD884_01810 [Ohtaekwangia sp.]|nr:hypothetical protein [Ohtaekwangia sp.]
MRFTKINDTIKRHLISSFAVLDAWFDKDIGLLYFKSRNEGACITDMLYDMKMMNDHFLNVEVDASISKGLTPKEYFLDIDQMEQAASNWQVPVSHHGFINLEDLRRQLREQLNTALLALEMDDVTATIHGHHPLSHADETSWDGFHRLYFIGLAISGQLKKFEVIADHYVNTLVMG